MASRCRCCLAILDRSLVIPAEATKSWRFHTNVQYNHADFHAIRYCFHALHAQFFDAFFPPASEHCSVRQCREVVCQITHNDDR